MTITSMGGLLSVPLNAVYHATEWAPEGWSEGPAFELQRSGTAVNTIAPGGIATDFAGHSPVMAKHEAYRAALERMMARFSAPGRTAGRSTPEQLAEVVWGAVTHGRDQLRHVTGPDAQALDAQRRQPVAPGLALRQPTVAVPGSRAAPAWGG